MSALEIVPIYVLGTIVAYAAVGQIWVIVCGGILTISAIGRYLYKGE